jgi:hypothetical protein
MDKRYKATRIQVDFADGSKLVADGEEAGIVWEQIEGAWPKTPRPYKILPNGRREPWLER